jgi:CubicO group peptidase (beta-lactamase class C family)
MAHRPVTRYQSNMKRLFCTLLGFAILLAPTVSFADEADTFLQSEMQKHQIAGLSLMVIKSGRQVKAAGYGVANLELNVPATTNTVYEIGSVTKQFTAAGILLLAQDGKLSLDDKISAHLKDTPASWSNITVRHLLTHTSGITNYTGLDGFELRRHLTQAQFIREIGKYPLAFQPGDKWSYCNSGFSLLGYIIENVSGTNYWEFQRERIFKPLGMEATRDRNPHVVILNRASGYELTNHVSINRDYDLTDIFSAGAIVSTVADMAKWDAALNGDALLTAASKQAMWTPAKLNDGKIKNYGFGWFLDPYKGHKSIGHNGATSGFSAAIQRFPDDALAVIILSNTDEQIASTLAKKVAELYFDKKP